MARRIGSSGARRALVLAAVFVTIGAACASRSRAEGGEPAVAYRTVAVRGQGTVAALRARLDSLAFEEVLRLNRVDADHVAQLDSLVLPEPEAGFRFESPFPARLQAFAGQPKALVVSVRVQAFAAYDSGSLVRWGPVSSGAAASPTLAGAFHVTWKLPEHRSSVDSTWVMRWCVNIENRVGMALHQYVLVGRPASHCCIRMAEPDARWVYDWVGAWQVSSDERRVLATGTPVWVLGAYDFDAAPPWRRLPADGMADHVSEAELSAGTIDGPGATPHPEGASP